MRKSSFSSAVLTFIFLALVLLLLGRMQNKRPATHVQELTRAAEAGTVSAEDHFSPDEDIERIDITRLDQARSTVDIAMYAFTDRYLADEVKRLAQRGVKIRIYRDQEQYEEEQRHASKRDNESTTSLLTGEANVQIRVKGHRELMHLKAYLIDDSLLRDGSANWSPSGEKRQDNNAHFSTDPAQVAAFRKDFNEMWDRTDNLKIQ
ncbi:MAG TPA: phospholipase D-like domain-containing protein [Candidatus Koribacter sp.]|jgi:phosphatidylserine/phosphatidylglycerophosphate/cardiolipin synthase-like enzyme